MIVHSFKVDILVEEDDQTDSDFIEGWLNNLIREDRKEIKRETGTDWPADFGTRHVYTGLDRRDQPPTTTPHGETDGTKRQA